MDPFKQFKLARFAALFLAVSVVTACDDDGAGPAGTLDPVETATTIENVANQFFVSNTGVQSLNALSDEIFTVLGSPTIAGFASIPNPKEAIGKPSPELLEQVETVRKAAAASVEMQIPVGLLGNTLVYDEGQGRYVIDEARTGADPNGVRFILYAINQATGKPLSPPSENEIGYVDIIDTSDFPTVNISVTVVAEGQTLLDVTATGSGDQTSFNLTFDGTLSDGTDQVSFGISINASATSEALSFSLAAAGLEIGLTFSGTPDSDAGTVTLEIFDTSSLDRLVFDLSIDASDNLTGSVALNDTDLALISGTFDSPIVTNGDGDPLTDQELAALEDLFVAMGAVVEVFFGLVELALFLLVLGFA